MSRARAAVVAGALAVAVTAGCAGQTGAEPRPGSPQVMPEWSSCAQEEPSSSGPSLAAPLGDDAMTLPLLGDDFVPVTVVVCHAAAPLLRQRAGMNEAATESRSDDVAALVAALRLPDQPSTGDPCTADLVVPPWIVLLDEQGRWVRPGIPHDVCGKPRIEVRNAVAALPLTTISSRPASGGESSEAKAAGCGQTWADMVWANTTMGAADRAAPIGALPDGGTGVRLCAYRVPTAEQRTAKPAGTFIRGGPLSAERWTAIERSVRAADPAVSCTVPANTFAVLRGATAGAEVYVELDGCRRLMVVTNSGPAALRQAAPALLTLLAGR